MMKFGDVSELEMLEATRKGLAISGKESSTDSGNLDRFLRTGEWMKVGDTVWFKYVFLTSADVVYGVESGWATPDRIGPTYGQGGGLDFCYGDPSEEFDCGCGRHIQKGKGAY